MHDVILKSLSAQMHVRKKAEQRRIVRQRTLHFHPEIIRIRRNHERVIIQLQCEHPLLGRLFREYQPNAGLVASRLPIGGVMHLKNQV